MEMSPQLADNSTPIQVSKEIPDLTPNAATPKYSQVIPKPSAQSIAKPIKTWSSIVTEIPTNQLPLNIPTSNDFADLMPLVAEIQKIFTGIKDIKALTAKMQSTESLVDKLMYLGEAVRGPPTTAV
ncbi:hypothetical protein AVEN_225998-1 [Araneus ventricosus]|uniref:Uncharacterized protein n=1 Tax=Araneus ventricosus TaxID=182803 RepID=A0A4Y2N7E6_ARAVE|nr:hypothetical protein AVEN_225998-1 [Araneus ventricosus]